MSKRSKKKRSNRDCITASKVLTESEFEAFIKTIPDSESVKDRTESLILWTLINCGVRVSELCNLRPRDCPGDLGRNVIEVHWGKGGNLRNIPVDGEFADEIESYIRDVRPRTLSKRFAKTSRDGWLFYDSHKKKYTRWKIRRLIERISKKAGIKKHIHVHMLRHTFATFALVNGMEIYRLQKLLGHRNILTTQKYLNPAFEWDVQTAQMLNHMPKRVMRKRSG